MTEKNTEKFSASQQMPFPIEFSDEQICRYQEAHFQHYGVQISKEEAATKYGKVIRFVRIALHHRRIKKQKEARHG